MSTPLPLTNRYAASFGETMQMAEVFFKSGVFGDVEDAAQACVKIMKGAELGLPPITALESIDILKLPATERRKARVSLFIRAHACAALIRTCGYGAYDVLASSPTACTILFRRKEQGCWTDLVPITYTLELAKRNRLLRDGSQWEADPENMLYQRAMKRGCERYFPELVKGLQISDEAPAVTEAEATAHIADLWGDRPPGPETDALRVTITASPEAPGDPLASPSPRAPRPAALVAPGSAQDDWEAARTHFQQVWQQAGKSMRDQPGWLRAQFGDYTTIRDLSSEQLREAARQVVDAVEHPADDAAPTQPDLLPTGQEA